MMTMMRRLLGLLVLTAGPVAASLRGRRLGQADDGADRGAASTGVFFADSFDAYPLGSAPPAPWSTEISKGAVSVEEFSPGIKAVRTSTEAADSGKTAYLTLLNLTAMAPGLANKNTYYGRMRFYLEKAPEQDLHYTFIQGTGLVAGADYRGAMRFGGQLRVDAGSQLMVNYDTPDFYGGKGPGTDCWNQGQGRVIPEKTWSCAEWKFDGEDAGKVAMQLWLDGREVLELEEGKASECVHQDAASYVLGSPDFASRLDLGWESYNGDPSPRVFWVDDVALGTKRIGCDSD